MTALLGDDPPPHGTLAIYVEGQGEAQLVDLNLKDMTGSPILGPMFLTGATSAAVTLLAALGRHVATFVPGKLA